MTSEEMMAKIAALEKDNALLLKQLHTLQDEFAELYKVSNDKRNKGTAAKGTTDRADTYITVDYAVLTRMIKKLKLLIKQRSVEE